MQLTHSAREEKLAVQKDDVLHLHAHYIQSVPQQFGLPFQQDRPVQYKTEVDAFAL